ncbi:MAG: hypothetical protein GY913_20515 [Proteobacteria bacterium]|nr:hypothetical protein [Pseudomonadota bacterium]
MVLLALACTQTQLVEGRFDGPVGVAVLHPEDGGPFYEPTAYVSNSRNGRIVQLDVKHGWLLADDPSSPFLDGQPIPTGTDRILGEIAVYAPDAENVSLFVGDSHTRTLLSVDYVQGVNDDGSLITARPVLDGEVVFEDVDGSGETTTLDQLELRTGYATTEDWVLEFDGTAWSVTGSRSGLQTLEASGLEPYATDDGSLSFVIHGAATKGDRITFSVDSGVDELDLGGVVEGLVLVPDALLVAVTSLEDGTGWVSVVDPIVFTEVGRLPLGDTARPHRFSTDLSGDLVYISDARDALVYEVLLDAQDPDSSAVRALEMPGPVTDVAYQADSDYEHLFVGLADEAYLHVYDLSSDSWIDTNPATPGVDPMYMGTPIVGMATGLDAVLLQHGGSTGERPSERVVAVGTFEGVLSIVEGRTGCMTTDELGPYATLDDTVPFSDAGETSTPNMDANGATGRPIQVNPCGGIAVSETWTATYDGTEGNWVLEGTRTGIQEGRAWSDERYISDDAGFSFLIRSGTLPETAGDRFTFHVFDGTAEITGDTNDDGLITGTDVRMELPARPVPYSFYAGPDSDSWEAVNRKVGVLWPQTNSDTILRVNLQAAEIEAIWD